MAQKRKRCRAVLWTKVAGGDRLQRQALEKYKGNVWWLAGLRRGRAIYKMGHYFVSCIMVNGVPREVPSQNPRGRRTEDFWLRDLPKDSIHHDSPEAFPYNVIL